MTKALRKLQKIIVLRTIFSKYVKKLYLILFVQLNSRYSLWLDKWKICKDEYTEQNVICK